jgi:hypothetical protein
LWLAIGGRRKPVDHFSDGRELDCRSQTITVVGTSGWHPLDSSLSSVVQHYNSNSGMFSSAVHLP